MLSKQALDEYREIYRNEHGEVPSDEILVEEAIKLLTVFDLVYRPIKKVWLEDYERQHTDSRRVVTAGEEESPAGARIPQSEDRGTKETD